MSIKLPYLISPGTVPKILQKIKEARQPEIFTQDFLSTKLGFKSGNARPIIPLMKKMGFLSGDGKPTELYGLFRNDSSSPWAMAQGIKSAYSDLYEVNEYAHALSRADLTNLVIQLTGLEKDNSIVTYTVSVFEHLKSFADFDLEDPRTGKEISLEHTEESNAEPSLHFDGQPAPASPLPLPKGNQNSVGLNLSYTINLNLPETTNIDVFNAIFKSLKDNLLESK